MKFALDTLRDIRHGDRNRRIHALFAFALWFVAGAFVVSTAQYYFASSEAAIVPLVGGSIAAVGAALVKFS